MQQDIRFHDSTGNPISVGDKVVFRGKEYTIKEFSVDAYKSYASIYFIEPQNCNEVATEVSVTLIT